METNGNFSQGDTEMSVSQNQALQLAAAGGHLETVRFLHQNGADLRAEGDAALRLAAAGGHLETVRYLVDTSRVRLDVSGGEAVRCAAANGHLEMVRFLHQNGADLRAEGDAALRTAAAGGHLETVRFLHQNGADPRADNDAPLRLAAANGHLEMVRFLHQNGADLRAEGDAALRTAAAGGHLETVRFLHQNGADPRADNDAPLRLAAANGHLEMVRFLHQNGADLRAEGDAALRLAAGGGHLETVRFLHQNGANLRDASGGEALRCAALNGHGEVVNYLHENGAASTDLTQDGQDCIAAMMAEIFAAPPVYHPSEFWTKVGSGHMRLLFWAGEANFKRTINQNYLNFIPASAEDPRIAHVGRVSLEEANADHPEYRMEAPDCDPNLWVSWHPSYQIFREDPRLQRDLYLRLVHSLYEFVLKHDPEGVLHRLEEPLEGNPIRIWRNDRLISQDLANSVWERNAILSGLLPRDLDGPLLVAELGAGYGRLGHVLVATANWRFMVFDIAPALYLSQWYLAKLFPGKRIFRFRRFREFSEIEADVRQAEIAFFTSNQLEKFPDRFFDVFVNVSSLHEMRLDQISHFLALMARTTRKLIYLREYEQYLNAYDKILVDRANYVLPDDWKIALERPDSLNPGFFELLLRRSS